MWKPGEARRPEGNNFRIEEAWRGQEASTSFLGSRAKPGGPNQHTSVVEEAWRGQEASKSFMGSRAMPGGPKGTRWYC